jgi:predicted  nucleic acid-binding Zn-ribbon protein
MIYLELLSTFARCVFFRQLFDKERLQLVQEIEHLKYGSQRLEEECSEKTEAVIRLEEELRVLSRNLHDTRHELTQAQKTLGVESLTKEKLKDR